MRRAVSALALTIAMLAARPAPADFAAGVQAYDGGDYATAFAEWMREARAGNAEAQIAVAAMYQFGEGRPADAAQAAHWYRKAAEQGRPIAQLNLGEMYSRGLGVPRDRARAHLWLTLAARNGNGWARSARDDLARRMTRAERRRAASLLARWDRR